jgi:hypothetical protein
MFLLFATVRLTESLYSLKSHGDNSMPSDDFRLLPGYTNTGNCLPAKIHEIKHTHHGEEFQRFSGRESNRSLATLSGSSIYVDPSISSELQNKVNLCDLI